MIEPKKQVTRMEKSNKWAQCGGRWAQSGWQANQPLAFDIRTCYMSETLTR
jgi:hypothetical protein